MNVDQMGSALPVLGKIDSIVPVNAYQYDWRDHIRLRIHHPRSALAFTTFITFLINVS